MLLKIKYQCFNNKSIINNKNKKQKIMEKTTKSSEIKKMLTENKSAKEISLSLNVSVAYIYKLKKDLNKIV